MVFKRKKKVSKNIIASIFLLMVASIFWEMRPSLAQEVASEKLISQAAEPSISSNELTQFAKIIQQVIIIDEETTQQMVKVIQEEGMTIDRFNAIVKWKKNPQEAPTPSVSDKEMESFQKVVTQIAQVQEKADGRIQEVFQSQELKVERFNQILEAVRQDPNLQSQVQQILQK